MFPSPSPSASSSSSSPVPRRQRSPSAPVSSRIASTAARDLFTLPHYLVLPSRKAFLTSTSSSGARKRRGIHRDAHSGVAVERAGSPCDSDDADDFEVRRDIEKLSSPVLAVETDAVEGSIEMTDVGGASQEAVAALSAAAGQMEDIQEVLIEENSSHFSEPLGLVASRRSSETDGHLSLLLRVSLPTVVPSPLAQAPACPPSRRHARHFLGPPARLRLVLRPVALAFASFDRGLLGPGPVPRGARWLLPPWSAQPQGRLFFRGGGGPCAPLFLRKPPARDQCPCLPLLRP